MEPKSYQELQAAIDARIATGEWPEFTRADMDTGADMIDAQSILIADLQVKLSERDNVIAALQADIEALKRGVQDDG